MIFGWRSSLVLLTLRNRTLRRGLLPVLISATLGWTVFGLLQSMTLSPEQSVEAAYGQADGQTSIAEEIPPGAPFPPFTVPEAIHQVTPALLANVTWRLDSEEVVDTAYSELALPSFATVGRLELLDGRWPAAPGEVAISRGFPATIGMRLQPQVGSWPLHVVGVVQERYQRDAPTVHGSPGSWAQWRMTPQEASLGGFSANPSLFWQAADPPRASHAIQMANPLGSGEQGSDSETLRLTRSQPSARAWLERGFLAFVLPIAGALVSGALLGRWLSRIGGPLRDIGLPGAGIVRTQILTLMAGLTATLVASVPTTYLLVWAVRPLVARTLTQPPHPWSWMLGQIGPSAGAAVLAGCLATFTTARLRSGKLRRRRSLGKASQRALGVVGWSAGVLGAFTAWTSEPSFRAIGIIAVLVAVCAGCAAPVVLLAVARLRFAPGRRLAGIRAMRAGLGSYGPFAGGVVLLTAVCASGLAIVGGGIASGNAKSSTGFPPGMAVVNLESDVGTFPQELVSKFERDLGLPPGQVLWQSVDTSGPRPLVTWTFASISDVAAVLGPLGPGQRETLSMGESLQAFPEKRNPSVALENSIEVGRDLRWVAFVRIESARPADRISTSVVYSGLTPMQDRQAYEWANQNGVQPAFINTTSQGKPVPIPITTQLAAIGFSGVITALAAVLLRNEVSLLRPHLAGFVALGLGVYWVKGIVLTIGLILGAVASLLSLAAIVATMLVVKTVVMGDLLIVGAPWIGVSLVLLGPIAGGLLGALVAASRLVVGERKR